MTWVDVADGVDHFVTAGAVFIGGLWAYFKFIRGRTFANRAELALSASIDDIGDRRAIRVELAMKNAGLTKIDFAKDRKIVWVTGTSERDWSGGRNVRWQEIMLALVLQDHEWIEALETINDEVLLPVPHFLNGADPIIAYRLHWEVWAAKRRWPRRSIRWAANVILPLQHARVPSEAASARTTMPFE